MAQFSKLPQAPTPRDYAAQLDLQSAVEKWNQLSKSNYTPSPEGQRFLKAVELGFVEDSVAGYQRFIGWLVATKEDIISAQLFAWYGFLLRYVAFREVETLPTTIHQITKQFQVDVQILQSEFAAIYEVDEELLDGVLVDIGSGYIVPKIWVLDHSTDAAGRQTITYRVSGGEVTTTVSFGGTLPPLPPFETHLEIVFTTESPPSPGDGSTFATLAWREVNKRWVRGVGSEIESVSPWQRWVGSLIRRDAQQIGSTFAIEDIRKSTSHTSDPDGRQGRVWDITGLEAALLSDTSTAPPISWEGVAREHPFDDGVQESVLKLLSSDVETPEWTDVTIPPVSDINDFSGFGKPFSNIPKDTTKPVVVTPETPTKTKWILFGIIVVAAIVVAVVLL